MTVERTSVGRPVAYASWFALAVSAAVAASLVVRDDASFTVANTLLLSLASVAALVGLRFGHTATGLGVALVLLVPPAALLLLGGTGFLYLPTIAIFSLAMVRKASARRSPWSRGHLRD